jgi:hypothetical protein
LDSADVRGILGLLLVDGSLLPYPSPGGGYVQLTLTAGATESVFLEEKIEELKQFIPTKAEIVPYRTSPRANGKTTAVLRFRLSSAKLRPIYNLLYPFGERQITQTTLDLLGANAAAWCWAEGCKIKKNKSSSLGRVGMTTQEAQLIASWLQMLTGAVGIVTEGRARPRLEFNKEETAKIQSALFNYAPKSRQHLFKGEYWDASSIRSSRTELLLGEGQAGTERSKTNSLA